MRIFITGATGFLGRYLTRVLCTYDYEIVAIARSANRATQGFENKLKTIILPKPSLQNLTNILKGGFDVVCHVAALLPINHLDPSYTRLYIESNVMLSLNILQASLQNRVKRFVYFSTGNAYSLGLDSPAKETDALYPSRVSPFYLGSKIFAEILVEHYRQYHSLDAISLRVSSPYGVGMSAKSVVIKFIQRALQGLPLQVENGGQYKADFVFVRDVIDLTVAALHSGPPGVYNVGSGVATSILELAQLILEVFERDVPIGIVSANSDSKGGFRPLNIEKARTTWNWYPRSLKDGLRAMRAELEHGQR